MRSSNTFGVHFTLRNKEQNGKLPIYARIVVNKTRCELSLKHYLPKNDWNEIKGVVKSKNEELKQLNSFPRNRDLLTERLALPNEAMNEQSFSVLKISQTIKIMPQAQG